MALIFIFKITTKVLNHSVVDLNLIDITKKKSFLLLFIFYSKKNLNLRIYLKFFSTKISLNISRPYPIHTLETHSTHHRPSMYITYIWTIHVIQELIMKFSFIQQRKFFLHIFFLKKKKTFTHLLLNSCLKPT